MNKFLNKLKQIKLTLFFSLIVFFTIVVTLIFSLFIIYIFSRLKIIREYHSPTLIFASFGLVSLILGAVTSSLTSRKTTKPFTKISEALDEISKGNYDVELNLKGPDDLKEISSKFNNMTKELKSVEMLRSDFINTFSHEFKTPIVSIRGFAKLLKKNNLSSEEKEKYLNIIIDESERLSELATNVLSLSKIEQQSILTNKTRFNVSEEIRLVISLLSNKLTKKNIDISLDCEEVFIFANEELLKQVWINLLDNAIKFSPEYGNIAISIRQSHNEYLFRFSNQGEPLSEETKLHIFDKFYQGEKSRSIKGNGLGLTIAKKIVELHNGYISIEKSDTDSTVFLVSIKK